MKSATKSQYAQVLAWLLWIIVLLVFIRAPESDLDAPASEPLALTGVITPHWRDGPLFPWKYRLRVVIRRRRRALRQTRHRVVWAARLVKLALRGALTMATIVDLLTQAQLRRYMGALPILYGLLEVLDVRRIINCHCPTAADVDHGTVAMVMILNRMVAPRPLYCVADWVARTVLVYALGVPAEKFNDDRLGRTLDAISQHSREIWQDIVHRALVQADVDLSVIFYDLTAFIAHGEYADSEIVTFGFAHNTPMNKRKIKAGLDVTADGGMPTEYTAWPGRTADMATVQENMERLRQFLERRGWPVGEVIIIGDRANLNDELAFAYDDHGLRYLAGLKAQGKSHRELLLSPTEAQFRQHPLSQGRGRNGYWGVPCQVIFEHAGRKVTHKGLVVLSGPMRSSLRRGRATQLRALRQELHQIQAKIGQPWYRTTASIQRRANTVLKNSPVGKFMRAEVQVDGRGQIHLRWWIDRATLLQAMRKDGRYLLVTNDWSLSPQRMFDLYRSKDGVEKRFHVSKSDLKVSPIYLHKDERIEGMLLINMLALLVYSLLERQARQGGLQVTTRRLIEKLETLDVVETMCWDGSLLRRVTPVDEEQAIILETLVCVLSDLGRPRWPHLLLPSGSTLPLALPPPRGGRSLRRPALAGGG
jgi:transposase